MRALFSLSAQMRLLSDAEVAALEQATLLEAADRQGALLAPLLLNTPEQRACYHHALELSTLKLKAMREEMSKRKLRAL